MIDLIVRLRNWERVYQCDQGKPDGSLYLEAADHIEKLEAEIKNLKAIMRGDGGTKKVSLKDN